MDLKEVIFFFAPGFISTEVARALRPEYQIKTNWDRVASVLLFSITNYLVIYVIFAIYHILMKKDLSLHHYIDRFTKDPVDYKIFILSALVFAISLLTGWFWGKYSPSILEWYYNREKERCQNFEQKISYLGDKPLWDRALRDHKDYHCEIFTKSGDRFKCEVSTVSTFPDKEGLIFKKVTKIVDGEEIDWEPFVESIYLPGNEVKFIAFVRGKSNGIQELSTPSPEVPVQKQVPAKKVNPFQQFLMNLKKKKEERKQRILEDKQPVVQQSILPEEQSVEQCANETEMNSS